jgi:hypothetical protein
MNNLPFDYAHELIPDGWQIFRGSRLPNIARPAGIPYRVVQQRYPNGSNWANIGILIPNEYIPQWQAAEARAQARRDREANAKHRTPQ